MARAAPLVALAFALSACGRFFVADDVQAPADAAADDAGSADGDVTDDATAVVDGGSISPCDAHFCCNFDEADGACAWTGALSTGDGGFVTFGTTTDRANSAPRSLKVLTDDSQDGVEQAFTLALVANSTTKIHFDVLVGQAVGSSSIHPLEIRCGNGRMSIKLKNGGGPLDIGNSSNDLHMASTYPMNAWFRVDVTVEWPDAGTALFRAESDAPDATAQVAGSIDCPSPVAYFGGMVNGTGTYEMYLDDIVVE